MKKLEGHIFQPITPWLEEKGISTGGGWNMKCGCVPEEGKQIGQISKALDDCNARILKRVLRKCKNEEKKRERDAEATGEATAGEQEQKDEEKRVVLDEVMKMTTGKIVRETKIRMAWRGWVQQFDDCPTEEELMRIKGTTRRLVNCPVDKYATEGIMM